MQLLTVSHGHQHRPSPPLSIIPTLTPHPPPWGTLWYFLFLDLILPGTSPKWTHAISSSLAYFNSTVSSRFLQVAALSDAPSSGQRVLYCGHRPHGALLVYGHLGHLCLLAADSAALSTGPEGRPAPAFGSWV